MKKLFGSSLLLVGTCIGAGMLALPLSTAALGFWMAILLLAIAWMFMSYTGYLVVEANLWMPENTSYISMSRKLLGKPGEIFAWIAFLLLLYCLLAAYMTGGGTLVMLALKSYGLVLKPWEAYLPWVVVFAILIYAGTKFADIINRLLILGLVIAYSALGAAIVPHIHFQYLMNEGNYKYMLGALPVLLASFGYHIILPSMRTYLHGRVTHLRLMVFFGSTFTLIFYALWLFLIFGAVPRQTDHGLLSILHLGKPTEALVNALTFISQDYWLGYAARFFALFAIASSFLGISLGLFDLLADGLKIKRNHLGKTIIAIITFVPPFIFAVGNPGGFVVALGYAGVFVALLHGILPAAMVWSGRYSLKIAQGYRVIGGRVALIVIVFVSLVVIYAQVAEKMHWIPVY